MKDTPSATPIYLLSLAPYFLIAWGYGKLTDGDAKTMSAVLGVLLLVRLFEMLGSVLSWRLHGKKIIVNEYLEILRADNFPKRECMHDNLSNYLSRIEDPYSEYPPALKADAKKMIRAFEVNRVFGILTYMRVNTAAEAALDIYSPRSEAPQNLAGIFGNSDS